MNAKTEKKLSILTSQWYKSKSKLQKIQAKEANLRTQIDAILVKDNADKIKIKINTLTTTFSISRNKNYSIPKASIPDIKANLNSDIFDSTFTTSYSLKKAVFEKLTGENKSIIEKHLTIKDAPLSIKVKEVE